MKILVVMFIAILISFLMIFTILQNLDKRVEALETKAKYLMEDIVWDKIICPKKYDKNGNEIKGR